MAKTPMIMSANSSWDFGMPKGVRIFADGVLDNLQAARGKELNSLKVTTPFLDGDNIHTDLFLFVTCMVKDLCGIGYPKSNRKQQ